MRWSQQIDERARLVREIIRLLLIMHRAAEDDDREWDSANEEMWELVWRLDKIDRPSAVSRKGRTGRPRVEFSRESVVAALRACGSYRKAAAALGVSQATLIRWAGQRRTDDPALQSPATARQQNRRGDFQSAIHRQIP